MVQLRTLVSLNRKSKMNLPKDVLNLILNYAASLEEYERRCCVHEELRYKYLFSKLDWFYYFYGSLEHLVYILYTEHSF